MKTESEKNNNKVITGIPSKELFITMLVKDITLRDAIGDLIDNSVDAANKNARDKNDLSNFLIEINIDKNYFEISDNAGGIEENIARESAFKLGKPKHYTQGKHTIGQFGIGMKRAFFKIGEQITVESTAFKSSFKIKIDVPEWRDRINEKDWDFDFKTVSLKEKNSLKDTKTKILIKDLKNDTTKQFTDPQFLLDLKNEIELEHLFAINKGLRIKINETTLQPRKISLLNDREFKPCYWRHDFPNGLKAEIIAGASEDINEDGGYYIFCNERLIIGPDTTSLTGWTGGKGKGEKGEKRAKELPKYHDQYFRFRGFVFFNAEDSSKLPWTTSKTTDRDSSDFAFVKVQMVVMARQVIELLDKMKKERERGNPDDNRKLNNKVNSATLVPLLTIIKDKGKLGPVYIYPKQSFNPVKPIRNKIEIKFSKPKTEVEEALAHFEVTDPNYAGSLAFDYFYDNVIK